MSDIEMYPFFIFCLLRRSYAAYADTLLGNVSIIVPIGDE